MKRIYVIVPLLLLAFNLYSQTMDSVSLQLQIDDLKVQNTELQKQISELKDLIIKYFSNNTFKEQPTNTESQYEPKKEVKTKVKLQNNNEGYSGQCKATTRSGSQCKRKAGPSGYCWQHEK